MSQYDLQKRLIAQAQMRKQYVPPEPSTALRWWIYFANKFPLYAKEVADEADKHKETEK